MLPHDPGFVSGFIGVSIDFAIQQIFYHVTIALRCKEELRSLRDLLMRIEPVIGDIQQYRLALNTKREIPISKRDINMKPSPVNEWLKRMDSLLRQASAMAQDCTIPTYHLMSRYRTSRRIIRLTSDISQHLELVASMGWASVLQGLVQIKDSVEALGASSSASTSAITTSEAVTSTGIIINEPLIVGQHNALERLENLLTDAEANPPFSRIGVVGKGGSGKSLLLKTLFNSRKVRDLFSDGLFLWLTVSQTPSIPSLQNELKTQIDMQTKKVDPSRNMDIPLNESLQGKRLFIFLDDVWNDGAKLLEDLGVLRLIHLSNSKIIVSSRDSRALLEMGVAKESKITLGDLIEDDSWRLFCYYAFPYNKGNLPEDIDQETAKVVCRKCGGLPLAIKTVARAMARMARITDAKEWDFAVQRLPNANSKDDQAVYSRLRLSYDALGSYGVHLQLGFLYLAAAFLEDQVVKVESDAILLWMGEGLLGKKKVEDEGGHDPFKMGRMYVNVLADCCLIEPTMRDVDGSIVCFRMHDVLRGLAIQIAEDEENFYCRVGKGLTAFNENEFSSCNRIMLNDNDLSSLSESWKAPKISSLLLARNDFTEIPKKVIGSMMSLKILDLTGCPYLRSLPESVGCLKQLVYLSLAWVPIKRLPASLTNLAALQILELEGSEITELPSDLHRLRSLSYLDLHRCSELKCVPYSISGLTSLQCLYIGYCSSMTWTTGKNRHQKAATMNSLGSLRHLKRLQLDNYGETMSEGTLQSMVDMETLQLKLTNMTKLPDGIFCISKLRKLCLECPDLVRMESKFCEFHNLSILQLWCCEKVEELPDLHKLRSLKKLDICGCIKLKRFPKEFGERGAFPLLEIFSMVQLYELEELPSIEEGAMPSLKTFTIMLCEVLKMFPENYWNLKRLQKLRVYGCPIVLDNLEGIEKINKEIEVVTMSTRDVIEVKERYLRVREKVSSWLYSEFSSSELFLFLRDLERYL